MKRTISNILTNVIVMVVICLSQNLLAQNPSTDPLSDIIPPGPTSASLGKYGNIPVGLHTGNPNISIPLIVAEGIHIDVPISVSYHSGGIRIEEVASWVGLGWSLNAGGVVTRTVRGKPDELGYFVGAPIPDISSDLVSHYCYFEDVVKEETEDSEPDLFHFNFNGYVGELFFDQNKTAYHNPHQNLKIEANENFSEIHITTPDGVKYIFGDMNSSSTKEENVNLSSCTQDGNIVSSDQESTQTAWYLSKIVHFSGEEVIFNYTTHSVSYKNINSETEYYNQTANIAQCGNLGVLICERTSTVLSPKLSSIETAQMKVEFVSSGGRLDLDGGLKLDRINIKSKADNTYKYFDFTYNYFQTASPTEFDDYRLRLDKIQEWGGLGVENIPPHSFEYIAGSLPNRLSYAQDHWGFYNGQNGNTSLIPMNDFDDFMIGTANREPDINFSKIGMLEKITYPTGGHTQFEYEAHTYSNFPATEIEFRDYYAAAFAENGNSMQTPFTVDSNVDGDTEINFWFTYDENTTPTAFDLRVRIFDNTGDVFSAAYNSGTSSPQSINLPAGNYTLEATALDNPSSAYIMTHWQTKDVVPAPIEKISGGVRIARIDDKIGTETIKSRLFNYNFDDNGTTKSSGWLNIPVNNVQQTRRVVGQDVGGGIGVPPLACQTIAECMYTSFMSVSNTPLFYKSGAPVGYREVTVSEMGNGKSVSKFTAFSDEGFSGLPNRPYISTDWKKGLLTEKLDYDENDNMIQKISNQYDLLDNGEFGIAKGLAIAIAWERSGCNVSFDCGDQARIIDEIEYAVEPYELRGNVALLRQTETIIDGVSTIQTFDYDYADYNHVFPIISTVTNSDDTQYITKTKHPLDYGRLNELIAPVGQANRIATLIENNLIAIPIEITQYVKTPNTSEQVLSSTITEFEYHNDFPYPERIWKTEYETPRYSGNFIPSYAKTDSDLFTDIVKDDAYQCHEQDLPSMTYNHYDAFGNPTEIQKTFDQPVALTWSYDGTRVTSVTKNAAYEEVAFTSFEHPYDNSDLSVVIEDGNWNYKMQGVASDNNTYYIFSTAVNDDRIVYSNTNIPQGDYLISFWAFGAGSGSEEIVIEKDDVEIETIAIENDVWKQYAEVITLGANDTDVEISIDGGMGIVYVDDLRLHPTDGMMSSYAYAKDSRVLTGMSDESHRRTEYSYDDLIRLKEIRDFEGYLLQTFDYFYEGDGQAANAQDKNYIKTQELLTKISAANSVNALSVTNGDLRRSYQYFDGLGRLIQSNQAEASANDRDLITFVEYDEFNRIAKEYLPFAYSNGATEPGIFLDDPTTQQAAFYNTLSSLSGSSEGSYAFTENTYEPSPLNRVEAQNAAGQAWSKAGADRAVTTTYRSNTTADEVHDFSKGKRNVDVYDEDELNVTEITDENGNVSRTYVDKIGRTVMTERVLNAMEVARTYTVYDDYNLPIAVIPPQLAADMKTADNWNIYTINNFRRIYAYQYDHRRLVKIKAVPGGGTTKLFYNKLDLPVMTVDNNGNQIITKYDILNRPIITGDYQGDLEPDNSTNASVFEQVDENATHFYTLNNSFPTNASTMLEVHSVTYYDDYDLNKNGMIDSNSEPSYATPPNTTDYESTASSRTRNVVTSTKTAILEEDGTTMNFLEEHTFYDDRARVIQTQSDNHLNGEDKIFNSYNFPGWLLKTERQHSATVQGDVKNYTIKERYEHDHAGRELVAYHQVNSHEEVKTCAKFYDERDLLRQKRLHEVSDDPLKYLQFVDYKYNIRGWMTDINNTEVNTGCLTIGIGETDVIAVPKDLFAMRLSYDASEEVPITTGQFNGNIAAMEWKIECMPIYSYAFEYDGFDRLESATQYERANPNATAVIKNAYSVPMIKYDLDGNIEELKRNGRLDANDMPVLVDDLTYTYSTTIPNHLTNVSDAADGLVGFKGASSNYTYDRNGNLLTDSQKGFSMDYNYMNLPNKASFSNNSLNPSNNFIAWKYDAMGQKLQKKVTAVNENDVEKEYCGGIEYNNGELEAIYFSEGRIVPVSNESDWTYEYTLSDHLGNNRVTFKDSGSGSPEVIDENHYYPFGMLIEDLTMRTNSPDNDYLYNGKELDEELGVDLQHYGFRLYDASIARFSSVDPIAEQFAFVSPFNYAENEPVGHVDLWGLQKADPDDNFVPASERPKNYEEGYEEWVANNPDATIVQTLRERLYTAGQFFGFALPSARVLKGASVVDDLARSGDDIIASADDVLSGLTKTETGIANTAKEIVDSELFKAGIEGMKNGTTSEVTINGVKVVFQADGPFSGFTLFSENGFVVGKEALKSSDEITKTVLHETYRISTSSAKSGGGVTQNIVTQETNDVIDFVERAFEAINQ
ncbi:MAG: DUF6443 domain-containing protein [Bacteroidota bacterium]